MKRILLIGRTGQVGWELRRTLAPLGKVVSFDRQSLDLLSPDSVRTVVREVKPHVIVNAAAYTAVDKAETEPELAFAVNSKAPAVLAEEAKRFDALVVHYSTDYVFDGTKTQPYVEDDVPNPLGVYGKSKLAGEDAIQQLGCRHLIFRTSWVYATRGRNFMLTMLRLVKEHDKIRVVDDQIGAPTWSRMIAEASALVIAKLSARDELSSDGVPGGVYHMTASSSTSWYGFAKAIFAAAEACGRVTSPVVVPIRADAYPLPAPRPRNSLLDNNKLCRAFGIALPAWQDALSMCMQELQ